MAPIIIISLVGAGVGTGVEVGAGVEVGTGVGAGVGVGVTPKSGPVLIPGGTVSAGISGCSKGLSISNNCKYINTYNYYILNLYAVVRHARLNWPAG